MCFSLNFSFQSDPMTHFIRQNRIIEFIVRIGFILAFKHKPRRDFR